MSFWQITLLTCLSISGYFYSFSIYGTEEDTNTFLLQVKTNMQKTLQDIEDNNGTLDEAVQKIQSGKVYESGETINDALKVLENQYRSLRRGISMLSRASFSDLDTSFSDLDTSDIGKLRGKLATGLFQFRMSLNKAFDEKHDFSEPIYANMAPDITLKAGISPKDVKDPKIRKDYEERLAKNSQLAKERHVQIIVKQTLVDTEEQIKEYLLTAYSKAPRADEELLDLLEKYKYPEPDKIKLLCQLQIPYKGFREWQSTDKFFKATAKFISLDSNGEVTLEKEDGKQTTIELSVLWEIDQRYVQEQMKINQQPNNKTPLKE
jgi:hypothetical protein